MYSLCENAVACETAALFDEATILAGLDDDTIKDLGWETGSRVVMSAVIDSMAQIEPEALTDLYDEVPDTSARCDNCYMRRNDVLRLLTEDTPEDASNA